MAAGDNHPARRRKRGAAADISAGVEHHRAGRLDRAEALYRKALRKEPANPDALHLLGVIAAARGNSARAVQLIGKALLIVPDFADGHYNLGNALRTAGGVEEAVASYRRAIELRPDFAGAHTNLGVVLSEQGELAAAIASCERATALDPRNVEAQTNLGQVLRRAGRLDAAEGSLRRAAALDPGSAACQIDLGNLLVEQRRFREAAEYYQRASELNPALASARRGLATCLRAEGNIGAAIASYRDALARDPDDAATWNDLGRCHVALGHFDDAAQAFRRAVATDPNLADSYRNLANCRLLPADHPDMAQVAALAARADLPVEDRVGAYFAIAKVLDDAGRFNEAFAAYEQANRLYRTTMMPPFDATELTREIDRIIRQFTPDFLAAVSTWGDPSELPVFIVGVPRSGTSLVEQIAASHSRVFGAGELRSVGKIASELGPPDAPWTPTRVRHAATVYLQKLHALAGGADRVIDKLPDNIFMLGVIAALYPAARVVFCRRDPRDVGLSCYFQKFSAGLLKFSYDLAECGYRIRETERLAEHWRRVLPLRWLDVQYESLVADVENESRRLIDFLGLEWEPACLDFHRTERTVQTASSWQVRQPLFQQSVGRWHNYTRHLGPLLEELALAEET